ncbi:MAG TPA: protein kinase [Acidobacteriota bacterium]|nr:protein kinase [Acidobacteriota bacterium]
MSIDRKIDENSEPNPIKHTEVISEVDANDDFIPAVGRFERLELLGVGGMARVYKAFDPTLGRTVALKFIRGDHPEFAERLLMEARSQARIEHEHVCKVYETGTVYGKPFIAMQFIKGETLSNFTRKLSLEQKVKLMKEVADGVHAAHRAGLIHRDLKPSNIMVELNEDGDWKPYVMDFGIAREIDAIGLTMPGTVIGSAWYMPPEQARGDSENLDRRTDVYSLGATMYELICGKPPFDAQNNSDALLKVITEEPVRLRDRSNNIPVELETIVSKCLEKEPSRRYESARALAEDLTRYLDGEPIHARPTAFTYRLYKKIRKHKALVATIAIATILTLVLGIIAIQTQLKAKNQARLAQQFGEEAATIEGIMRTAHLYPLHDITGEKQLVRNKLKRIEEQIKIFGESAEGPGHYAIARGHLSLNEFPQALDHITKAWNSGYTEPQVAYTLGLASGGVYQKEMEEVLRIRDPEIKKKKRTQIEKLYKEPALKALKQHPQFQSESTEYVEALIAFYEDQWEKAIEKSNAAIKKRPQFYEATLLKADAYTAMAIEQFDKGNIPLALEKFPIAQKHYEEAASVARSDPKPYIGLCKTWNNVVYMTFNSQGGDLNPLIQKGISACDRAIYADPEHPYPYALQLQTLWLWGKFKISKGENPTEVLTRATETGKNAIRIDPKNGRNYALLGQAYLTQGQYETSRGHKPDTFYANAIEAFKKAAQNNFSTPEIIYGQLANIFIEKGNAEMAQGKNPEKNFNDAIANYEKAIKINPKQAWLHVNYGLVINRLMAYKAKFGEDPSGYGDEAIAKHQTAIRLNPDLPFTYNELATTYINLAAFQIEHGQDPSENLKQALNNYKKAISLNKEYPDAHSGLGTVYRMMAEHEISKGQEPKTFEQASYNLSRAILLNPGFYGAFVDKAILEMRIAEYQISKRQNPENALNQSRSILKAAQQIDSSKYYTYVNLAETEIIGIGWLIKNRKNPEASLNAARENLQKAQQLNSMEPEIYALRADYSLKLAQWQEMEKKDFQNAVDEGIEMADQALALNPKLPKAFAVRALLNVQKVRSTNDDAKYLAAARSDWQKALSINKSLSLKYDLKLD